MGVFRVIYKSTPFPYCPAGLSENEEGAELNAVVDVPHVAAVPPAVQFAKLVPLSVNTVDDVGVPTGIYTPIE